MLRRTRIGVGRGWTHEDWGVTQGSGGVGHTRIGGCWTHKDQRGVVDTQGWGVGCWTQGYLGGQGVGHTRIWGGGGVGHMRIGGGGGEHTRIRGVLDTQGLGVGGGHTRMGCVLDTQGSGGC